MNYFPGIKVGDIITLDGEVLEATAPVLGQAGFWFKNVGTTSYYHMSRYLTKDLEELFFNGRMVFGNHQETVGGYYGHSHTWVRYKGVTRVYDYCDCGAKKEVDWRKLGDAKRKDQEGL